MNNEQIGNNKDQLLQTKKSKNLNNIYIQFKNKLSSIRSLSTNLDPKCLR